ncbi:hypothetical protein RZS28_06810 [Methylocapsa polymorpha]|uniref:Uncharacterized protein n=1 Tax=Methylocapsa polymorpha TaxID=3080828 RepID=A0ABZ0HWQ8_9HYPH|nr:hypothetical protein RZS28_06810 [Methylocapsa sp. RX1]
MSTAEVIIQVRYNPKGECIFCGEAPEGVSAQDWHNHLSNHLAIHALSGGRAAFYTTFEDLAKFKAMEGAKYEAI